ncbi:MAG: hypothetical protein KGI38_08905 [Thaumarchaeota archaeon]|nr:hypothetical protein [Nitrososphaerota archaeon]
MYSGGYSNGWMWIGFIVVAMIVISAAAAYEFAPGRQATPVVLQPARTIQPVYVARVEMSGQGRVTQQYNYVNIAKDSLIVAAAGAAIGACTDLTLGACAAAGGSLAGLLDIANDQILTANADANFTNVGNGTATNWSFLAVTYINGVQISNSTESLPTLVPGQTYTFVFSKVTDFGSIPTLLWGDITSHQDVVSFGVEDIQEP